MNTLERSLKEVDMSGLEPLDYKKSGGNSVPPPPDVSNSNNSFLLGPVPPLVIYPDTLRVFYHDGGGIPQTRVVPPKTLLSS